MSKIASTVPPLNKPRPKPFQGHDFHPFPTEPIIHGTAEPRATGERYCSEKIAELVMTQHELAHVVKERDALRAVLEEIRARSPMALLSSPPKDFAAEKARETLAKLASGELRKPTA